MNKELELLEHAYKKNRMYQETYNVLKQALEKKEQLEQLVKEYFTKRKKGESAFDYYIRKENKQNRVIGELDKLVGKNDE